MATAAQTTERRFLLSDIDWETYARLRAVPENRNVRMTYDRGVLELLSPSELHERLKTLIGRAIEAFTEELNIPIRSAGSTTWKKRALGRLATSAS